MAPAVPHLGVDQMGGSFSLQHGRDLIDNLSGGTLEGLFRRPADMRGEDDIFQLQERMS